jgi:hypothetical protein
MAGKSAVRWTSVAALGGALGGALLAGGGVADAAAPTQAAGAMVVPASCGQTVTARQGDLVEVRPEVGRAQRYVVSGAPGTTQHIQPGIGQPFCDVAIQVAQPVMMVAPAPAYTVPVAPAAAPGAVAPGAVAPGAPLAAAPAAPRAAAPAIAPTARAATPKRAPHSAVSDVPLTAAAPGAVPGAALAPGAAFAAAPAASAPASNDPAARVLPASEASKITPPASRDGLGVPVILALIAGAGVAAGGVRVAMTRKAAKEDALRGAVPPPEAPAGLEEPEAAVPGVHEWPTEVRSPDEYPTVIRTADEYPTEIHAPVPSGGRHSADDSETVTISRALSHAGR